MKLKRIWVAFLPSKESKVSPVEQLHSRADAHFARFEQGGGVSCIEKAVELDRQALGLCPPFHPKRWASLNRLQHHLSHRYRRLGTMEDMEETIVVAREALDLCPLGHPDRSRSLNNLANRLSTRYNQLGTMMDLDEAIVLAREALDIHPRGHPARSVSLNNFACYLSARYKQLGAIKDLNEAIELTREALELRPRGHRSRSKYLNNLANDLSIRYKHIGVITDLDEAILLAREALELRPRGHPDRSKPLNNLAYYLSHRYNQLGSMTDLNSAITLAREALELRPRGHPLRSSTLNNLALCLSAQYNQFGMTTDLNEAIVLAREALELRPRGHPDRSTSVSDLACHLRTRFQQSSQFDDGEELFRLYAELTHVSHMVSSSDLSAAREWVDATEDFDHPTTLLAYETSLRLLVQHLAALPSLPQHLPIHKKHVSSLAVDAFSAGLRNHDPVRAVELLEQGRGVFWNQIARLRSPLDDVVACGPAGKILADEFTKLTSQIRDAMCSADADQHDLVCRLNLDLQRVVANIRGLPGLARFLLPPSFLDLRRAASDGPVVVVNSSKYTCDALIVFADREPVHVPLRITKDRARELSLELQSLTSDAKMMDVTRDLAIILRELWDEVVFPVVDLLKTSHSVHSRIWWCPTAEFSLLPLHAAGPYRSGQQNLSDLYISSYTPTLTALIRAKRSDPPSPLTKLQQVISIGHREAEGERDLLSVGTELSCIGQYLEGCATFTRIEGAESSISRVSEELHRNEWIHLACHGLPNRERPFESAFALCDGYFTIEHIMNCDLRNSQFAYLSACHTTVGDEESPDEVIHLASAMHFAGFRSVIGTMWGVDDGQTNKITSMFYTHMVDELGRLDHTRAAFALNETMRSVNIPFDQRVLYIHIGA